MRPHDDEAGEEIWRELEKADGDGGAALGFQPRGDPVLQSRVARVQHDGHASRTVPRGQGDGDRRRRYPEAAGDLLAQRAFRFARNEGFGATTRHGTCTTSLKSVTRVVT